MLTGQALPGRDLSGNLAPNANFEEGELGQLPAQWQWQIKPTSTTTARLVAASEAGGRHALRIDADLVEEKPRDNYPIVVSKLFELSLGHAYRLTARMKASRPDARANLMLQSYVANNYFWASSPNEVKVGEQWEPFSFTFRVPAAGNPGYHELMKQFRVRFDFPDKSGYLLVDDVCLQEIEMLDEWKSWQALGMDQHSLIADPLFVDAANDDYRLRPDSPAYKLGFQPIPFDKIGPYQDDLRAAGPLSKPPVRAKNPCAIGVRSSDGRLLVAVGHGAAGPPTKDELPLDVCWSASRWSLHAR